MQEDIHSQPKRKRQGSTQGKSHQRMETQEPRGERESVLPMRGVQGTRQANHQRARGAPHHQANARRRAIRQPQSNMLMPRTP